MESSPNEIHIVKERNFVHSQEVSLAALVLRLSDGFQHVILASKVFNNKSCKSSSKVMLNLKKNRVTIVWLKIRKKGLIREVFNRL